MKLHRPLLRAVEKGLDKIFNAHQQSEDVVAALFQSHPEWGSRDRRFIAENIFDIVRYKKLYAYCGELTELNENYFNNLAGVRLSIMKYPETETFFPNLNITAIHKRFEQAQNIFPVIESIPGWLDEFGRKELNEKWETEIHTLNQRPLLCLRHNPLRCQKNDLISWLNKEKLVFKEVTEAPDAIVLEQRKNLKTSAPYRDGWFEIQDTSSQRVAPFLRATPGMKVLDACAGTGGKSLHLAALLKNSGEIFSCDVGENKLREVNHRAKRGNAGIIQTHVINDSFIAQNQSVFDRILLDVPCSGSGTLRRKPDLKWNLSKEKIDEACQLQRNILSGYKTMLKKSGFLAYSTCSIFPSENQSQAGWFLSENKNFSLAEEKIISPHESGFDGFYMALFEKLSD